MSVIAVGAATLLIFAAALILCYITEGRTHPELEDHDWYRG